MIFGRLHKYRIELFLLAAAVLPHIVITLSNPNTILDWYSSDDGFYYFQVARNLAEGHGFTFDGINETNGFHPLWLFLITPIFALAQIDILMPLRVLILFSALISGANAILLYRILRPYVSSGIAILTGIWWIMVPRIHDITMHAGVESGINALTLLLYWHGLVNYIRDSGDRKRSDLVRLGFFGVLAILARLDNVFIVGAGSFWLLLNLDRAKRASKTRPQWSSRLLNWLVYLAPIGVVMLLYLTWNLLYFGTAIPVSGQVKAWWGTLRNTVYGFPVRHATAFWGQFFTDDPELGPWSLATSQLYRAAEGILAFVGSGIPSAARRIALVVVGALAAGLAGLIVLRERDFFRRAAKELGLLPYFLACFAQISYYKFSGSVAQQPWYWIAEMILILFSLGLLIEGITCLLRTRFHGLVRWAGPPMVAGLIAVISLSFAGFIQGAIRLPGDGSNHYYYHRPAWLEQNTELGARIAITGAGNLGYFIEGRTIINLDGLINSYDYFLALKSGRGADFLRSTGVDYIFGNEYILTETNPYETELEGHLQPYEGYVFGDRELILWRFLP
ncbi:MAG: hypothetical protein ACRDFQ_02040 [Anaerolineales bacterium]